jgi:hypothetical protein
MAAEKVQQSVGLRTAGSEMDVGDKQSAKAPFRQLVTHSVIPMREQLTDSRDSVMTRLLFEHDLFGKPVPTFLDHALVTPSMEPLARN